MNASSLRYSPKSVTDIVVYSSLKAKVCSSDGDTDFFDIVSWFLQEHALAQYLSLQTNSLYPAETITDADYIDDMTLQANTPTKDKYLLEQATGGISLYVNADKM